MPELGKTPPEPSPALAEPAPPALPTPAAWIPHWHKAAFILFLIFWGVNMVLLTLRLKIEGPGRWVEALYLLSAAGTTLLTLGKRLPLQNVITSTCVITIISAAVAFTGTVSGIPFGPYVYSDLMGPRFGDVLPWAIPVMWLVSIVNSRGVARLIMRPWRKTNYYGFWVIGLTCVLALILDLGLEPFAVEVKRYWAWQTPPWVPAWYTAPWVNFLGWFVASLAILAFSTPWLINKRPVKLAMDYHPLVTWILINIHFLTGNALHQLWWAVGATLAGALAASVFAIRGARW